MFVEFFCRMIFSGNKLCDFPVLMMISRSDSKVLDVFLIVKRTNIKTFGGVPKEFLYRGDFKVFENFFFPFFG